MSELCEGRVVYLKKLSEPSVTSFTITGDLIVVKVQGKGQYLGSCTLNFFARTIYSRPEVGEKKTTPKK